MSNTFSAKYCTSFPAFIPAFLLSVMCINCPDFNIRRALPLSTKSEARGSDLALLAANGIQSRFLEN